MVKKDITTTEKLADISTSIRYCAILKEDGTVTEKFISKRGIDGEVHSNNFPLLISTLKEEERVAPADAKEIIQKVTVPKYAMLSFEDYDLIIVKAEDVEKGYVTALLRKGSWTSAIVIRLQKSGNKPRSVKMAAGFISTFSIIAGIISFLLFASLINQVLHGTEEAVMYIVVVICICSITLSILTLLNIPGYLIGNRICKSDVKVYSCLNMIPWVYLGLIFLPILFFLAIPITYFIFNKRKDTKEYFGEN